MTGTYHRAIESDLQGRIDSVYQRIAMAAERSGRSSEDVRLVAVTKTVTRAAVNAAYQQGLREFGENRVDDALEKFDEHVPPDLVLHMIGPFRDARADAVVGQFDMIHSVDRPDLLTALANEARDQGKRPEILLQVNIAGEEQKHGCHPDALPSLLEAALTRDELVIRGLMAMAPFVDDAEEARPYFVRLRELRDELRTRYPSADLSELSMGMTNDFDVAIEEGATIVRVGRAIFNPVQAS